jgi:hypothetical protein
MNVRTLLDVGVAMFVFAFSCLFLFLYLSLFLSFLSSFLLGLVYSLVAVDPWCVIQWSGWV